MLVDTLGLVLPVLVHPANVQDRDGGITLFTSLAERFPLLEKLFADGAHQGRRFRQALAKMRPCLSIEIVTRYASAPGFVVLPKRWLVERTIAWLNRCRRLAKDFEASLESAHAWLMIASVKLLSRRIARAMTLGANL